MRRHFTATDATAYAWTFARTPMWLVLAGRHVPHIAFRVAVALLSFADREEGTCYPSHAAIAARAGVSERSVPDALEALRALGIVTWTTRKASTPGRHSYRYTVWIDPETVPPPLAALGVKTAPDAGMEPAPHAETTLHRVQRNKNHVTRPTRTRPIESRGERDDEHGDIIEFVPDEPDRHSPPATERQMRLLRDAHLLGGGKADDPLPAFTVASADRAAREALTRLAEPEHRQPPDPGTPEYAALSAQARRLLGQWKRERHA